MGIESRIKLRQLTLAVAIRDSGSVRRAADRIGITQPAATKALRDLEEQLGVILFERSKSGMTPTSYGEAFVGYARRILSEVRSSADAIREMKQGAAGEVAIGTLPAAAMTIVPRAIALARAERPGLRIHLFEGSAGQLVPALQHGEIDIIVGRLPPAETYERVAQEFLCDDPNVIVCRKGHPLDRPGRIGPALLIDQEWVLPDEGSHVRTDLRRFFGDLGLSAPEPALVTSSTVVRLTLVMMTDMIAVLTLRAAEANVARGLLTILDVGLVAPHAPIVLATRENAILTPAAEFFIGCARRAGADAGPEAGVLFGASAPPPLRSVSLAR